MADPNKIPGMIYWPLPISVASPRKFLGLIGYYCKFFKNYETIIAPLTYLLKKNSFIWTKKDTKALKELKLDVTKPSVVRLLDFSPPFTIKCDASERKMEVESMYVNNHWLI